MKYKKGLIFICLFICLFSIASICASDVNETVAASEDQNDDLIEIENQNDEITINDNSDDNVKIEENNIDETDDSIHGNNDILSYSKNNEMLNSSPPSSAYSVSISDTTINYGSGGNIIISVKSCSGYDYKYDFYLIVYDSNNREIIKKNYYNTYSTTQITHSIDANKLPSGTYIMKIINYADSKVMSIATLTSKPTSILTYPSYTEYSVRVSDTTINYGSESDISMRISPAPSDYKYKYNFYLKVYDSNNNIEISKKYSSIFSTSSETYTLSATRLNPGRYTVKIINYDDNEVMDTATLTVNSPTPSSGSNVNKMSAKTVAPIVKKTVKITVKNIKGYQGKKVKLTAIIKDGDGRKIKSGTVFLKFRGKTYKVKIKNGKAKKIIKIPKTNNRGIFYKYKKNKVTEVYQDVTYKGKVYFLGNKYYFDGSSTFKVASMKKSKTKKYTPRHISEETGEVSHKKHKIVKKHKKHKKVNKKKKKKHKAKKKKKSYGYYPKYHKKIPNLNVDLFKKEPQFNTNTNLNNIIITT